MAIIFLNRLRIGNASRIGSKLAVGLTWPAFLFFSTSSFAQNLVSADGFVESDSASIYYRTIGVGPPLLLVHGYSLTGEIWQPFIPALSKKYQLVIPDMRGHGRSTNTSGKFRYNDAANDLKRLLDQLNLSGVRALGWSSGAMAILELAVIDESRLEAIVLAAGTHRFSEDTRQIITAIDPDEFVDDSNYWQTVVSWHPRGMDQMRELLNQLITAAKSPNEANRAVSDLSNVGVPTLIIQGDRDPFNPIHVTAELHGALPNSELWTIPGVAHELVFAYWLDPPNQRCGACMNAGEVFWDVVEQFFGRAMELTEEQ